LEPTKPFLRNKVSQKKRLIRKPVGKWDRDAAFNLAGEVSQYGEITMRFSKPSQLYRPLRRLDAASD
jgi:hypothetical protein